jgi:predicted transcriptional regulator
MKKNLISETEKKMKDTIRLSLDLSPKLNDALESLAHRTGSTKTEVLRKSIALMEVAVEAREHGQKFGVAEKSTPLTKEVVGL